MPDAPDIRPKEDIFTVVIKPDLDGAELIHTAAQLRTGGWLFQPGKDDPVRYEGEPIKIGKNTRCRVTLA